MAKSLSLQRGVSLIILALSVVWFLSTPHYEPAINFFASIASILSLYSSSGIVVSGSYTWRINILPYLVSLLLVLFFLITLFSPATNAFFMQVGYRLGALALQPILANIIFSVGSGIIGSLLIYRDAHPGVTFTRLFIETIVGIIISVLLCGINWFISVVFASIPMGILALLADASAETGGTQGTLDELFIFVWLIPNTLLNCIVLVIAIMNYRRNASNANRLRFHFSIVFSAVITPLIWQDLAIILISFIVALLAFRLTFIILAETRHWRETSFVIGAVIGLMVGMLTGNQGVLVVGFLTGAFSGIAVGTFFHFYWHKVDKLISGMFLS
jgi:hypothetical protein